MRLIKTANNAAFGVDEIRYFFYITNDRDASAAEIVFGCNDRCDQENLIAQVAGGVRALSAPVDSLISNWAYMVMTSLAWTVKAWSALLLSVTPRHRESHEAARTCWLRMEFKTFVNEVLKVPCQVVRQGRRIIQRPALESTTPDIVPSGGRAELLSSHRATREIRCHKSRVPRSTQRTVQSPAHRFREPKDNL